MLVPVSGLFKPFSGLVLAAGLAAAALAPAPAFAVDAAPAALPRQLNLAGRQRLISQRLTAAVCFLSLGVDTDEQHLILLESTEIYANTLKLLRDGHPVFGLPPASDPSLILALDQARVVWNAVEPLARQALDGNTDPAILENLSYLEPSLLSASQAVVTALTDQLGDDVSEDADLARALDMAGRQRMLSQAVVKEACLISRANVSEFAVPPHVRALNNRLDLFELETTFLRVGDEDLQIAPPPNLAAEEAIDRVLTAWQDMRALLDPAIEGESMGIDELDDLAVAYDELLPQLEDVVAEYVSARARPPQP